ncbi:LysR family transcriptional regulator [Pseudomonas sp. RIT-PI-AD]|uniref:LysR family transcriptional regulator n=1 Tax=Pseudomonas sp. RIT-PI-AD TaxID=3035294 RepID=UPI0021D9DDEF|nr:LysR family transcriptional regulator [Pseudomonas sp. RIT-PI-AD]
MDRVLAMQVFTRIVELGAFGKAADSLGLSRASVTTLVKQLESHLGVQLLQRTTRQVSATLDGRAYYERCLRLLADIEEAESFFSDTRHNPQGVLRIDMPASLGRLVVIPALPAFCARYPRIQLEIGASDRPVDLIREGVDCVLRGGDLHDQSLVARPLCGMPQVTCASPEYLRRHGRPRCLEDLEGHLAVDFFSALSGRRFDLDFTEAGAVRTLRLPARVAVNSSEAYIAACEAGFGLIQAPRYHIDRQIAAGSLCEVLAEHRPLPMPLTALYPPHRHLSRRVRVFIDWLAEVFDAEAWPPLPAPV